MGYDPEEALAAALAGDAAYLALASSIAANCRHVDSALVYQGLQQIYKHGYVRGSIDALNQIEVPRGHTANGNQSAR